MGVYNRLKYSSPSWKVLSKYLFWSLGTDIYCEDKRPQEIKDLNNPSGLYIANHQSLMDIPLLLTKFQTPPIMKKSILYVPIFGLCAYSAGSIIVDRKSFKSRKEAFFKATERLEKFQKGLQYYPEGSRNREADSPKDVSKIKSALITYAYKNDIPVYSISICQNKGFFDKKNFLNFNKKVGLFIDNATLPSSFKDEDEFIEACWKKVETNYYVLEAKLNSDKI
jgi:1-acyl-sn-glycerol-3-phosphate acyltransferase